VDVEPVLGSRSTDTLSGVGPAAVVAGQRLPVGPSPSTFPTVDHVAGHPAHEAPAALSVLPGPRSAWIGGVPTLTATAWEVGPHSDRVGLRLTGGHVRRVPRHRDVELPSEGMVRGSVQLPPDGNPVVFLADHPVTGGYPVVAVLTEAAVDRAAQLRPGEGVRFVVASPNAR
jgi:allophanate hydrolase subunit 2